MKYAIMFLAGSETYVNQTSELVHVFVGGEEIVTTPTHPFYSPVKGWTEAAQLRAGDILVLVNGEYVVVEKVQHEILESPINVYNFQVAGDHTYYVSDIGVLVHNACTKQLNTSGVGQKHHPFSKKIVDAASHNPNLKSYVTRSNGGTVTAFAKMDHFGYQDWHRALDKQVVGWLKDNGSATLEEFIGFMNKTYADPDIVRRFGMVIFS